MSIDVHTLSGAYALDALDPEEAAEFRQHLAECASCRDEVKELRAVAAQLAGLESKRPPARLKARVLEAADRTTQDRPVASPHGAPGPRDAPPRRRVLIRLGAAAAAAVLLLGGVVGAVKLVNGGDDSPTTAAAQVFAADDARTMSAPTSNGGELRVAVSPSRQQMAVDTRELPPLDRGQVYQLWTVGSAGPASAALLTRPGDNAAMAIPDDGKIALTIEPAGGSKAPTTKPIVTVDPARV